VRSWSERRNGVLGACALLTVVLGLAGSAAADPSPNPDDVLRGSVVWNGDFDVADVAGHPIGWSVEGDEAGANVVNFQAYRTSGLTSLEINDKAGTGVAVRSERVPAIAGVRYTATAKAKGREGTPASLYLEFWGIERGAPRLLAVQTTPPFTTGWQTVATTAVAPQGTVHVTTVVYGTIAAAGISYWDEVRVTTDAAPYDPRVGAGRELFVDDYRVEELADVDRVVHPGVKDQRPLIVADKPWEKTVYYSSVISPAPGTFQLFYTCFNDQEPFYHTCLAESTDFVTWTKPTVGLIAYKGSTANNIVFAGGGSVTFNPDAPAGSRYRMMTYKPGSSPPVYIGFSSADGRTWQPVDGGAGLLPGGDVIAVTYDQPTGRYIATYKDRLFTSRTPGVYDRSAFVSTSTDFVNWTQRVLAVTGDVADDGWAATYGGVEGQIYGMPVTRYGNQYLGIPWHFLLTDFTKGEYKTAADGPVIPGIVASRDLVRWDRSARGPLIEPGVPGAWNDGALYAGNYFHVTDREVSLLYGGFNTWHGGMIAGGPSREVQNASIGRAVWRRDGFVSLTNGALPGLGDPGTITTKPLEPAAAVLHVNANLGPEGELRIEVLDAATDQPIPGFTAADAEPVRGDVPAGKVRWHGRSLQSLAGQQIKLRFHLAGGDLYSFWFAAN
jgi:hypothetical protein